MNQKDAKRKYIQQRGSAKKRGIEFLLTFEEWRDWWGDDIDRRGTGHDCLQMQRYSDSGPYALWNIKKDRPRENAKKRGVIRQNKKTEKARARHEFLVSYVMDHGRPLEEPDSPLDEELEEPLSDYVHLANDPRIGCYKSKRPYR